MAHLTPERLVDIAEGTEAERSVPHLADCDVCRRGRAELRATLAGAAGAGHDDVPEPSPLFWDDLSARVRDGVEQDAADRLRGRVASRVVLAGFAAAAAVLIAVAVSRTPVEEAPIP